MSLFSKLFLGFGAFLVVASAIYAVRDQEYAGLMLSLSVTGGTLLVGGFVAIAVQRARSRLLAGPVEPGSAADDEAHVRPTIWPPVLALSTVGLVIGMVATPWALVPGGILFVAASAGWVVDVQRQWRQHGHGESHGTEHADAADSHEDGTGDADPHHDGAGGVDSSEADVLPAQPSGQSREAAGKRTG